MAIIIPSKNIYTKDNDKVRDNAINRIEISAFEVSPNNEYNTSVYNEQLKIDDVKSSADLDNKDLKKDLRQVSGGGTSGVNVGYAFVSYSNQKVAAVQIKIPVVSNNKWIKHIKTGKYVDETTSKEENNIKVTLYGIVEKGVATATINTNDEISEPILTKTETSAVKQFSFPSTIEAAYSEFALFAKASQSIKEAGNLSTANYSIQVIAGVEYYVFDLNIFCDCTVVKLTGGAGWQSPNTPEHINMTGEYEKYVATNAELTLYGDTIGIDLNDTPIYVPDGSGSKPLSVEGNELMQAQNYIEREVPIKMGGYGASGMIEAERYVYSDGNLLRVGEWVEYNGEIANIIGYDNTSGYYILGTTLGGELYNLDKGMVVNVIATVNQLNANFMDTLKEYTSGKETATILCSISDYYDEGGDKVISVDNNADKMVFDLYDIVIPMVYGANGFDKPLSKYKDGNPKKFKVLGTRIFYDGAVWQELTLQETL